MFWFRYTIKKTVSYREKPNQKFHSAKFTELKKISPSSWGVQQIDRCGIDLSGTPCNLERDIIVILSWQHKTTRVKYLKVYCVHTCFFWYRSSLHTSTAVGRNSYLGACEKTVDLKCGEFNFSASLHIAQRTRSDAVSDVECTQSDGEQACTRQ